MNIEEKVKQFEVDWNEIDKLLEPYLNRRPKNSFTVPEFAEKKKISRSGAARVIKKMIEAGTVKKCGASNYTWYVVVKK